MVIHSKGQISIKESHKKPEVIRQAKKIGLIAGGTGKLKAKYSVFASLGGSYVHIPDILEIRREPLTLQSVLHYSDSLGPQ